MNVLLPRSIRLILKGGVEKAMNDYLFLRRVDVEPRKGIHGTDMGDAEGRRAMPQGGSARAQVELRAIEGVRRRESWA